MELFQKEVKRMGAADSKILVLPEKPLRQAPTCWNEDKLWFDKVPHKFPTDRNIRKATIARGIGERRCPTVDKWVAFSIAGAIIATLTGKYIAPPNPEPVDWQSDLEHHIWEALWQAVQENKRQLDETFVAAMLRSFLPRYYYAPPERPYLMSDFVFDWQGGGYADTLFRSVSNLHLCLISDGRKLMKSLDQEVATSIRKVTLRVPTMLEIAIERIRRTYMW